MASRTTRNEFTLVVLLRLYFFKFIIAGTAVFLFDFCSYLLLKTYFPALLARALSLLCAIVISWWINRTMVFQSRGRAVPELARSFGSQIGTLFFNYGTFYLLIDHFEKDLFCIPKDYLAFGCGVIASLFLNFLLNYYYVFARSQKA